MKSWHLHCKYTRSQGQMRTICYFYDFLPQWMYVVCKILILARLQSTMIPLVWFSCHCPTNSSNYYNVSDIPNNKPSYQILMSGFKNVYLTTMQTKYLHYNHLICNLKGFYEVFQFNNQILCLFSYVNIVLKLYLLVIASIMYL